LDRDGKLIVPAADLERNRLADGAKTDLASQLFDGADWQPSTETMMSLERRSDWAAGPSGWIRRTTTPSLTLLMDRRNSGSSRRP